MLVSVYYTASAAPNLTRLCSDAGQEEDVKHECQPGPGDIRGSGDENSLVVHGGRVGAGDCEHGAGRPSAVPLGIWRH